MQQVGKTAFYADARPVDPRHMPVPVPPQSVVRRARGGLGRLRILHGVLLRRLGIGAAVVIGLAGIVAFQEPIGQQAQLLGAIAQGEIAHAGFGIGEIRMSGQVLTAEADILEALAINPDVTSLAFDAETARLRIEDLPAVVTATIRKIYPADIVVEVTEHSPVARWRVDGVTFVVDAQGRQIGEDRGAYGELPLVIGDGAADDAMVMIHALETFPDLAAGVAALSRIGDRRWDMIYETGLRVQLPEMGVAQALRRLETYQRDYQLLERDLTIIDLRVPSLVALRPTEREDEDES